MYTNYSLLQVNDIAFHPVHFCLLATVGSDGKFSFWDKDARTKLKVSIGSAFGFCSCFVERLFSNLVDNVFVQL